MQHSSDSTSAFGLSEHFWPAAAALWLLLWFQISLMHLLRCSRYPLSLLRPAAGRELPTVRDGGHCLRPGSLHAHQALDERRRHCVSACFCCVLGSRSSCASPAAVSLQPRCIKVLLDHLYTIALPVTVRQSDQGASAMEGVLVSIATCPSHASTLCHAWCVLQSRHQCLDCKTLMGSYPADMCTSPCCCYCFVCLSFPCWPTALTRVLVPMVTTWQRTHATQRRASTTMMHVGPHTWPQRWVLVNIPDAAADQLWSFKLCWHL